MDDISSKTVLVWDHGLFLSVAETLSKQFGRVLYHCPHSTSFPRSNEVSIGEGIRGVKVVHNPWDFYDKADLFVFTDVYESDLQEFLIRQGKRVWGCAGSAWLELDRARSKEALSAAGVDIGPYKVITGLDALREQLRENDDQHVKVSYTRGDMETFHAPTYEEIEPRLDELEHNLGANKKVKEFIVEQGIPDAVEVGYDGYSIDGIFPNGALVGVETKDKAYVGKTMRYSQLPEAVRSVNAKMAPILKRERHRGFMSTEIRLAKNGAFLIDPCFSDDTEILTNKGWKRFQDLDRSETVATLNVDTGDIEYQRPTDYQASPYVGDMVLISNKEKGIECLVTPNHGVWRTNRNGTGIYRERADELTDKGYIPRSGKWHGDHSPSYTIPRYENAWTSGRNGSALRIHVEEAVIVDMDAWLRFLAVYLGDGSRHSDWSINIAQSDASPNKAKIEAILSAMPFKFAHSGNAFVVHSTQLADHVGALGLCSEKRVPEYVKGLSAPLIRTFLDAYLLCDGMTHKGQNIYYTTSRLLADDIQELIFKAGRVSNVRRRSSAGTKMRVGGKEYTRNHDVFIVSELPKQNRFWFEAAGARKDRYLSLVPYAGMVYDVTVPNHTVYVRRNGKPFWSSNCQRCGSPPSELYQNLIGNLGEVMWYGAEGIVVEPEYVAKWGAELILLSDWADKNWQQVRFPRKFRDNVKLKNFTVIDGEYYVIPQWSGFPEIGAIVATGATAKEAIDAVKEIAEEVDGYSIEKPVEALDEAHENLVKSLGRSASAPASKEQTAAEEAMRAGKISARQYERLAERNGWT